MAIGFRSADSAGGEDDRVCCAIAEPLVTDDHGVSVPMAVSICLPGRGYAYDRGDFLVSGCDHGHSLDRDRV